jgi:hypothetical protein
LKQPPLVIENIQRENISKQDVKITQKRINEAAHEEHFTKT